MMQLRKTMVTLVVLASATCFAATARAQTTWHVDDDNCPGPGTGSLADPFCRIQDGIGVAVDTDTVLVSPGTYDETINFIGKAIMLRSSDGPAVTIIDATGATGCTVGNCSVVKCVSAEGTGTVLDGFTITGGTGATWVDLDANIYLVGGGMFNANSSPTVTTCVFSGNTVDRSDYAGCRGGGMFNYSSSPTITACSFTDNFVDHSSQRAARGGGMFNLTSSPELHDCSFTRNVAFYAGWGGGMCNESSSPSLTNCNFSENTAGHSYRFGDGGGVYNRSSAPTLTGCTFTDNQASDGGGMTNQDGSEPILRNCAFSENRARFYTGGGMANWFSSKPQLENCIFSGNWAYYGGGMHNQYQSNPVLQNCTFSDNEAGYFGGGLDNDDSSSSTAQSYSPSTT